MEEIPARRGFSVCYGGKTLLSGIDPIGQAERLAAGIPVQEKTLYFCPSPLYGYGLDLLLGKLPESSKLLCAEADEALFKLSEKALSGNTAFISSGGKKAALTRLSDPEALCAFVRELWGERVFRRVELIRLSGGWQLFPDLYGKSLEALRREIALEWGNAMTLIRLGRLYTRNLIRNLGLLPQSSGLASLDFAASPVLVLGAGPSLDSLLEELAALWGGKIPPRERRRFKIVCVDTCLPALLERSILPDLVVILESQHWNLRDFTGSRGLEINAALDLSALPASARVLGGKRFFFATPWANLALIRRLEKAGILPESFSPLGSVGLSAAAIALSLGKGPVLAGGLDFSFTIDAYHARSTPGRRDLERKQNRFLSLVNSGAAFREKVFTCLSKNGKTVRSDPAMRNYRDLFEREFGGNPRLFDIDGSGLPLGVKTLSQAEAFAVLDRGGERSGAEGVLQKTNGEFRGARKTLKARGAETETLEAFIRGEIQTLKSLREILSGSGETAAARLEELLDTADYLWAHFPECAGAGGRRPSSSNLSFLKRVRTEIDPFLKLWEISRETLRSGL